MALSLNKGEGGHGGSAELLQGGSLDKGLGKRHDHKDGEVFGGLIWGRVLLLLWAGMGCLQAAVIPAEM